MPTGDGEWVPDELSDTGTRDKNVAADDDPAAWLPSGTELPKTDDAATAEAVPAERHGEAEEPKQAPDTTEWLAVETPQAPSSSGTPPQEAEAAQRPPEPPPARPSSTAGRPGILSRLRGTERRPPAQKPAEPEEAMPQWASPADPADRSRASEADPRLGRSEPKPALPTEGDAPAKSLTDLEQAQDYERGALEARISAAEAAAREAEEARRQELRAHQTERDELLARLAAVETSRRQIEDNHQAELERLSSELEAATEVGTQIDALERSHRNEIEGLRGEIARAEERVAAAEDAAASQLEELEGLKSELAAATSSKADLDAVNEAALAEADELRRQISDAEERLVSVEAAQSRRVEDLEAELLAERRAREDVRAAHLEELERFGAKLRDSEESRGQAETALAEQRVQTQRALEEAAMNAEAYDARVQEIQARLEQFERAARQANERVIAATSGGKQDESGRFELNTVTVEGLRRLGLSVTQAARLVRYREARGGFRTPAEIEDVPGLPHDLRADLTSRVYVDATLAKASTG